MVRLARVLNLNTCSTKFLVVSSLNRSSAAFGESCCVGEGCRNFPVKLSVLDTTKSYFRIDESV